MKKSMKLKQILMILLCLALVGAAALCGINGFVKTVAKERILTVEETAELEDVDCIIVLGCQVRDDGTLSHMLRDRLVRGLEVYNAGAAPKLLMSGDHGQKDYDEVNAMKQYAIDNGVASENVFMDHAGFSTSSRPTLLPASASDTARFTATVLLPTPPLPDMTTILCLIFCITLFKRQSSAAFSLPQPANVSIAITNAITSARVFFII